MHKLLAKLLIVVLTFLVASAHAADVSPPAARTIVLVRHGNYVDDPSADARLGPGLSPIGVAQAHLAGARLAAMPIRFDAMYASPMQRARDTAAVIGVAFPGRRFSVVDDLAECTPPTRRNEITKEEKPADLAACKARLDRVFETYFKPAPGGEHAELLRASGWSKKQIRDFVVAHTGRSVASLKRTGRLDGEVTAADETTQHFAMDTPDDLMLICAGSPIGALSMVMPGFGSSRTAGRSPAILIE